MDQVHNLHLQTVQEMGFIWEIDQAFSKSLMVEFLRLKVIIGDDLSETLQTWQADMEAATDKFLRDLDAVTQTSTTLPSKNAAVGVALRQFREAAQLRLALPLTRLDEAQEEMEKFIPASRSCDPSRRQRICLGSFPQGLRTIEAEYVSYCTVNLSGTLRLFRSS